MINAYTYQINLIYTRYMNTKQAEYLRVIAEEGSITAASRRLFISQPSLSQTLKQIEDDLGVTIFDRTVTPHKITFAGELVLKAADEILKTHNELYTHIHRLTNDQEGHLRLGISVQRSMQIIPYILPRFIAAYPHVSIELIEAGSAALEEMLILDKLDLALAATEPTSPLLNYELIEKETIGILAGKHAAFLSSHTGDTVHMSELAEERFVSLRPGHSVRLIQDRMFHNYGIYPHIVIETDSFEVARRTALETDLCMFCSDIFIDDYARTRGVFFPLKEYTNNRHFYACSKKNKTQAGYTEDLIRIAREILQAKEENR